MPRRTIDMIRLPNGNLMFRDDAIALWRRALAYCPRHLAKAAKAGKVVGEDSSRYPAAMLWNMWVYRSIGFNPYKEPAA